MLEHYSVCMPEDMPYVCVCTKRFGCSLSCGCMLGDCVYVCVGGGGGKGWSKRHVKGRY